MNRRKYFLTFGDGSFAYRSAGARLVSQASRSELFNVILRYDLMRLRSEYPEFWLKNKAFILDPAHRRGLGYWCWKPFLVYETLRQMEGGDVLLYCDAGCELDLVSAAQFTSAKELLEFAGDGIFYDGRVGDNHWTIGEWTNRLTLDAMQVSEHDIRLPQVVSGAFLLVKSNKTMELIGDWLQWSNESGHLYLRDHAPSDELPQFIEHRHDQALLSVIVYQHARAACSNILLLPAQLIEHNPEYVIHALRNISTKEAISPRGWLSRAGEIYRKQCERIWRRGRLDQIFLKVMRFW